MRRSLLSSGRTAILLTGVTGDGGYMRCAFCQEEGRRRPREEPRVLAAVHPRRAGRGGGGGAGGAALDELLTLLGAASRDELAGFVRAVAERAFFATADDRSGSGGSVVTFASGVWRDHTVALEPAFLAAAVGSYKAEVRAVDFMGRAEEAVEEINSRVS
ncbi:hypothetical protein BAE44_0002940 [Dichanthelium oligosanthes]|uniref:Serpin domain-containing protein n=1 Tax=Dichanthelium oligosanthes TaxID=888268 RepID=A0A1E5WFA2_9POAL|nr:hypothetical protein BAE44_0002940 [Dichanthelium oligosanthes]